ncbi:general transcription factor 3C polypeptide 3 [Pectinophora gossypiella]|uniref:general transcription factor 3C polypeptide 3 n=1 Tax=Pectinophora gossypiella TaxID=13191 RepID=UPI00214DF5FC|nr:general transcription factor 3C polypeptide 3 [Pectinophora gossypiella]
MDNLPGTSADPDEKMDIENELTNKFLSGEMSFADYSTRWYGYDEEENFGDDFKRMDIESRPSVQLLRKRMPKNRKYTRLSAALLGLMGEANLRFVRGDKETAEKMCHEIIKQVPNAPEPYQTLAQIYEHDTEKSLQFSLLAAHLSPPDANEWLRLAAISKQRNDIKQEMICYAQAIKAEPQDLSIHMKRLNFLISLEEANYPINVLNINRVKCYHKIVTSMPASESETIMEYAKMAAILYHNSQETEKALEVLSVAYKKCSSHFNMSDTNIFLELLMSRKQYQTCIEVFIANVGVDIEAEIQTVKNQDGLIEEQTNYLNCSIPTDLPIDLKSKLLICFIHLGAHSLVQTLLSDFLANDVERAGDLYMDIEEALSSVGLHELAMKLLEPLVKNTSFDLGAVWLKHAECLHSLGRDDDAIQSYHKVLIHAPQHSDARRKLFMILEKKGRIDEALKILKQDYKYVVSASLLYLYCCTLKKYNEMEEYLVAGEALLSRSFVRYRHPEELKIAFTSKAGIDVIQNFRTMRGENPYNEDDIHFDEEDNFEFTAEEEWNLFLELIEIACKSKQYFTMQRLSFGAVLSKSLTSHRLQIEFYCLQACLLANDYQNAMRLIKELSWKYPTIRSWNLLNVVVHYVEENVKFLSRLFQKEHYVVKNLFLGNSFLISGRYLVALKYFLEHHSQRREPLTALLIAITMLVMAAQRTVDKHHNLVLQGMCYMLTYQSLRKCDQETNYNLGRAYQMLSINNLAVEYYERALASSPIAECPQHGTIDLTRETAYNLYFLYKDHAPDMARKYMLQYLVV